MKRADRISAEMVLRLAEHGKLAEILQALDTMTRKDCAAIYAYRLRMDGIVTTDWKVLNRAIVERWSISSLGWIKALAWRAVTEAVTV